MAPLRRLARVRWRLAVVLAVAALVTGATVAVTITMAADPPQVSAENLTIDVPGGPGVATPVHLDATVYRPAVTPAPAVLAAHGFGGSKDSVSAEATALARRGFVVLAWTARGFGASTGQIALDSPDYEVADARALVDWLAKRPDVVQDAPGDPRVGVTGASYGGALALLLAGTDRRVDALAPEITWNDLAQALFPNAASQRPIPGDTPAAGAFGPNGVFKRDWAGYFFGAGSAGPGPCGRFRPEICAAYVQAATTGAPTPEIVVMLHRSSPTTVTGNITAPTLLVQGEQDTLFGLDQADATARQLAAARAPLKVIWYAGGHDGGAPTAELQDQVGDWFDYHLRRIGTNPGTGFDYQVQALFGTRRGLPPRTVHAGAYPGLGGNPVQHRELILHGSPQQALRPPGGTPAALSSLPGLNAVLPGSAANFDGIAVDVPGQSAMFVTDPLPDSIDIVGAPRIRLRVAAAPTVAAPPSEAVLFVKLYDLGPDGRRTLPGGAVAPVRIGPLPAGGAPVEFTVTLAGVVRPVQAGHRLVIAVATTDRGYALPPQPAGYTVSLGDDAHLALPVVAGEQAGGPLPTVQLTGLGGLAAVVAVSGVLAALRRRRAEDADPALVEVPLVVTGLTKRYPGGLTAVDGLSFRVEHGQVLGLLGPNGAGKTTVLRMLMGLIQPTSGELRAFGHRVTAGAAVLSRIGSFVEGPGFLPHLTGMDNLRLYWAATGRPPADAGIEEALAIAGLGQAVHRRVATYSHGMRQRLAIAQAMLGRPDLLVLDEPTNGLDPPQIHAMREVLRDYAARGATVLISSHLLAEVEQICSHVVVMHRGRLVAAGTVAEIVASTGTVSFTVDDPAQAAAVLRSLAGVDVMEIDRRVVHAHLDGLPCAAAVTALVGAGIGVEGVAARRALEEAFLQLVSGEAVE
ncbi:MAG: alpha/beta fold hydrolase [Actinomycetota bacterium]|nr:alpha/beta fold hydrolase [Actinomycetota bacterium]MDQ3900487.1 alpha/beta fold hydrolase [Actinomycetota bacterium]